MVIRTSSADELLNERKQIYKKSVLPSLEWIEQEIIPKWIATINTLDQHKLEILSLRMKFDSLEERVNLLERRDEQPGSISYEFAEKQVIQLLKAFKTMGKEKINILEIAHQLNLPVNQIDEILEKLEKEGIIKGTE